MISLKDLRRHLIIDDDLVSDDGLIVQMEEAAVAYLQNETGRYFGPLAEITEVLSSNGWAPIWLRAAAIPDSVETPVLIERRSFPNGAWETVPATDYEIDGQRLYPLAFWIPGVRTLRATYWAGYAEGAEPADVQQAARELVTRMYEKRLPTVSDVSDSVREVVRANRITVV